MKKQSEYLLEQVQFFQLEAPQTLGSQTAKTAAASGPAAKNATATSSQSIHASPKATESNAESLATVGAGKGAERNGHSKASPNTEQFEEF